jgi:cytochrome c oxidase subunit II
VATPASSSGRARWWSRRETREVFILWAVLTILLVIFSLTVPDALMGVQASNTMTAVERTFTVLSVAASPVAALVWAIAIYSLFRWRRKGDWSPADDDGAPIRGNRGAVALWIGGSSALCLFILILGLAALQVAASPSQNPRVGATQARNPLVVEVTGQQWVWTFTYPASGGIESDQLYLPVNRAVTFKVTSEDVIHSFWIVQMGIKVDANPGEITTTQTFPNRLGVYTVRCAELCGLLHADMETTAHVVRQGQFAAWLKANQSRAG